MHPIFFRFPQFIPLIGGRAIHGYGVMIALGFLLGMIYAKRESKRVGLDPERVLDLFFWTMVAGLVGSRLLYIVNSVDHFWTDPLVVFRVWEGGLVFQGGLLGGLPVAWWYVRKHDLPFTKVTDIFTPPLALGHALGRIGCFLAGCCYGLQCAIGFPLAVVFPENPDTVAPTGIPLYPTQLAESFGEFVLFAFLLWYRKRKPFDGAVLLVYLAVYSVLRSVIEVYRGDKIRGFIIEPYLSVAQFISLLTIIAVWFVWIALKKKSRGNQP